MQALGWCCMRSTFLQILLFSCQLRVISYSFPFHMHILCIWYGTVLAKIAVLSLRVCFYSLPLRGTPCKCYYNTVSSCDHFSSWSVASHAFSALCSKLTLCDRAFPVAAARAWNSLPPQTRASSSILTFRRETKSHLFRQSFG